MAPLQLALFDLDGTLKQARDPYVFLHQRLGTWQASQSFFQKGLAGELDYDEWLRLDAELWRGVPRATMEAHFRQNPYLPGARETVLALKQAGVRVAVVSTGLSLHAELVQADLGLDRFVANEIFFEDGVASGQARAHVPEGGKGQVVAQLQAEFGLGPDECLAVGDGTSDVDMFRRARIGVAVNPTSEAVRAAARLVLDAPDLSPLLPRLEETMPGWMPPLIQQDTFDSYRHLVARDHPWRRQLYLQGRNMTVDQLVTTMQANDLSPEEAAKDLDLPLAQVREALAYYELHRDLIDLETRQEASRVNCSPVILNGAQRSEESP